MIVFPPTSLTKRLLWSCIALVMLATGCSAASSSTGDPDAAVATAAAALEDAASAAIEGDGDEVASSSGTATTDESAAPQASGAEASSESSAESSSDDSDDAADEPSEEATPAPAEPDLNDAELPEEFTDTDLPPAPIGFESLTPEPGGPRPVSIVIEDIDVVDATIIPVGVNPDQTFEVPPADQVGWYRFGPAPGDEGSAVLAAHIAFNGVDGVFRHLADVEVGSVVVIGFDDGSTSRYRIETVTEYLKEELPADLFARDGNTQLALITCGGDFNRQLDSYDSNVVAVAVPI